MQKLGENESWQQAEEAFLLSLLSVGKREAGKSVLYSVLLATMLAMRMHNLAQRMGNACIDFPN